MEKTNDDNKRIPVYGPALPFDDPFINGISDRVGADAAFFALFDFSSISIRAYHAPPMSVNRIPIEFKGVMVRWNKNTANTIVSTCLTFAATVIVNADVFLFAVNETIFNPKAMIPFINNPINIFVVISVAPNLRTRPSSPVTYA